MPQAKQHNLIDPSIHYAVEADHIPREAKYRTTYDDETVGETTHVLYWDGRIVRSCEVEKWAEVRAALESPPP